VVLSQGLSAGVPATVLHTLLANSLADRTDVLGRSALHVATAGGGAPEAVRLLVGAGCDPNKPLSMDYRVLVTPRDPAINAPLPPRPQKRGRYALGSSIPAPRTSSLQHCSPLHLAAAGGYLDAVEALLGSPSIDVNARSADGATPLHLAAEAGQAAVAARLCRAAGVDVDAADSHGRTALHYAAAHGREFVVVELWARGARIDPADRYGWTPLHYAAREGYTEVAASLVIAGSQVQAGDGDGVTPAHLAAERGHVEVVDKLLMAGFVSDAGAGAGVTALHLAAAQGHGAVVHALLRAAAKPHLKDGNGCTAADVAARNGHFALVETLFKAGRGATVEEFFGPKITDEAGDVLENADGTVRVLTDADIVTDAEGVAVEDRTGLLHLLMHEDPGLPSAIVAAMKRGPITALDAVLPTPDGRWMSLAECAGAGGLTPLLRGLPDLFASPDVVTAALMAAVRQGREHTVHWILSTAASAHPGLDLPRTAAGALHVAAEAGDLDVLRVLLAAGFKAGGVDVVGRSAVAAAAAAVQEPAVLLLLEAARKEGAGEALDAGDEQAGGKTLLHHAVAHGMDGEPHVQ
jgi:ankyrin repeat protein